MRFTKTKRKERKNKINEVRAACRSGSVIADTYNEELINKYPFTHLIFFLKIYSAALPIRINRHVSPNCTENNMYGRAMEYEDKWVLIELLQSQ
jgi:hypothetical protein